MSLGFNLSTKKEDVSTRLKVQNLKRAKDETKKLENEGKKMEERLMELKLAMNREKEERERQGGGFWKSGQQGTLTTYAEDVLAKKKSKNTSSKGKVKILKDKPLDLPERSNQPGTMAYIAQKGSVTPRDKPKGPKCGQCEERRAAVSCVQCSEDYCAGCFAAFHLKGNLKKHRSIPITATPRQCFASPRPNPPSTRSSYDFDNGEEAVSCYTPNSARKKGRNSPDGASGMPDNKLLHGSYDEAEQAASFQEALKAWRTGRNGDNNSSGASDNGESRPITDRSQKKGGVSYSPVQTPTVNVDSSTDTGDQQKDIEITFNTSSMTYAERLLLKKHRRTDVDALFTPREGDESGWALMNATPRQKTPRIQSGRGVRREKSNMSLKIEEFNDGDFDENDRVDFSAIYQAVKTVDGNYEPRVVPKVVQIEEVNDNADVALEQQVVYKIQEEGQQELWSNYLRNQPSKPVTKFEVKPPTSAKSSRRKSSRKSARASVDITEVNDASGSLPSAKLEDNSRLLGSRLKDIENEVKRDQSRASVNNSILSKQQKPPSASSRRKSNESANEKPVSAKSRPQSSQAQPKNDKSRPQTGTRAQSRQGQQSRAQSRQGSRQGSRPSSRANSRTGSSRAASRTQTPGLLTKGPSEALKEIARMTPSQDAYKGIDSFFMVGVQPSGEQEERTLTPTQHKNKDEKIKVSYQLYNMAPRSWKPDNSVIDAVPSDDMENEEAADDRASSVMAYHAYSEQMVSDITERLISRFDMIPLDEDQLSDQSSGGAYRSLGEEYRTFTPSHSHGSSVQNSPSLSARATPVHMTRPQVRESISQTPHRAPPKALCNTPRQSLPSRSQTPRVSKSRAEVLTARSKTFHGETERPVSRAIVMEGTDLSIFDNVGEANIQNEDDKETLDQLEWELASEAGRITAEGKISRMEMPEDLLSDDSLNSSLESFRSRSRLGIDQGYDINSKLKKEELEEDEVVSDDESDVRNLM